MGTIYADPKLMLIMCCMKGLAGKITNSVSDRSFFFHPSKDVRETDRNAETVKSSDERTGRIVCHRHSNDRKSNVTG